MSLPFKTIALVGKPRNLEAIATHENLYHWLTEHHFTTLVDKRLSKHLSCVPESDFLDLPALGTQADLAIVIGGMAICWELRVFYLVMIFP